MTKKKSIIGAMLLLVAFAVSAIAGGSSSSSDFVISDGVLTSYTGTDTTVYVPDNTTTISAGAFNNTAIDLIYLTTTATKVENDAFANCSADVKIVLEMADPTAPLPSGMENWGVANAGGQITTYTTSGITTYTLSDVSAIAVGPNAAYIKDGSVYALIQAQGWENTDYTKITYANTGNIGNNAKDVSKNGDDSVMMWINGTEIYFLFDGDELVMPESMHRYFSCKETYDEDITTLTSIHTISGLENINTSQTTDMSYMFFFCQELIDADITKLDTSNATNLEHMFAYCSKFVPDISKFDTSKATDISGLFFECNAIEELDLRNFNTKNAIDLHGMFYMCTNLKKVDLSSFDTSSVEDMGAMFHSVELDELDISHFDTSNVKNMMWMFNSSNIKSGIDVSNFKTGNVTTMNGMFSFVENIIDLDLSHFDTLSLTDMKYMFYGSSNLTTIDLSSFEIDSQTEISSLFSNCGALSTIYVNSNVSADLIKATNNFPIGATVTVK